MIPSNRGFTLIEILIAVFIFAIITAVTTTILYQSFHSRDRVNALANQLNELTMALTLFENDTKQMVSRSIRGNDFKMIPAFIGERSYIEFTRTGLLNPTLPEKSASLRRIAYRCHDGNLYRRSWFELDTLNRSRFHEKVVLSGIASCRFEFINRNLQTLTSWRNQVPGRHVSLSEVELLPKAVRAIIELKIQGRIEPVFIIPEALYASISSS